MSDNYTHSPPPYDEYYVYEPFVKGDIVTTLLSKVQNKVGKDYSKIESLYSEQEKALRAEMEEKKNKITFTYQQKLNTINLRKEQELLNYRDAMESFLNDILSKHSDYNQSQSCSRSWIGDKFRSFFG